ncbi:MAG: tetratricopeptide repeat protein [Sedimentisphaerales bacterium]|nr:tetratricopeptide repeat protein [Sedimentisphaerales bacterium]
MKRILAILTIVTFLSLGSVRGQSRGLANAGKAGLYVRSLDQVLRLRDDELDLATATLIASEYWSDLVLGRRYLEQLDAMALEIRDRVRQQRLRMGFRAVPIINDYLFNELGYKTISHANDPNDLFLHSVMDNRQGYCLSLSILYLALAERLGLELYGVVVPGHFFVRYDSGNVRFNIETTSNGASPPDDHYMVKFNVPDNGHDVIYMKNLTKRQTLGCFFNNLGNVYNDAGARDTAMLALERAVAINPTLSESRANLGNIYLQKGRPDDAIRQYRAALQLNPNDPKTYNNLGNAYMDLDRVDDAELSYLRSLDRDPNFTDAYRNLALAYTRQEEYGDALSYLSQAITLDPTDALLHNQLADVYYRIGDYNKAAREFRAALNFRPDLAEAYYGLGLCFREQGRTADEIHAYKEALRVDDDMLAALVNLGNAYFALKEYDLAIRQYQKAAVVKPNDAWILFNLGSAYSNQGNFESAVEAYLRTVKLSPQIGDAHHGLAYGFYRLQKYELAWKHIDLAQKLGVQVPDEEIEAIRRQLRQ